MVVVLQLPPVVVLSIIFTTTSTSKILNSYVSTTVYVSVFYFWNISSIVTVAGIFARVVRLFVKVVYFARCSYLHLSVSKFLLSLFCEVPNSRSHLSALYFTIFHIIVWLCVIICLKFKGTHLLHRLLTVPQGGSFWC